MSELKPCPFCGGKASIVESSNGMMNVMYSIGCDTPCRMSPSLMAFKREEAINEWNNRPHENKIKADAVKKAMLNCDVHWSENIVDDTYRVSDIQDCADKLERGEL